ncbi:MAG: phosphonate metabolism protein/1,5-bisphosphokinase (PRPP-forming) PhnN [Thiomonas sp.]|uniref:phosphonate metabolism protein/1,5-bisphosphokinase (PRPP-forming) PhnN n=1 Tax=Thiomonas sp. TaxID=2047785 RepID=UPI002A35FA65|nr:phosphonate metabolism protein/1,5-bisphosphokinase (PRPP-forming) PhnN [Thiomonas sp.]MDY0329958.1 phosphonate metabolism protein/1,5-bisphosphokinase (PRPP-forming) PhnN [Thiomonas sp.]
MSAGRLIYVIGPSGAGKDSVLAWLMQHAEPQDRLHLARRSISRPGHEASEAHEALTPQQFAALRDAGAFAMHWSANGLDYGVRHAELAPLREGGTVLVNGSRGWLEQARRRFPELIVAQIVASAEVLAQRLQERGRETPEAIAARLQRARQLALAPHEVDISVVNDTTLDAAGAELLRRIGRLG